MLIDDSVAVAGPYATMLFETNGLVNLDSRAFGSLNVVDGNLALE